VLLLGLEHRANRRSGRTRMVKGREGLARAHNGGRLERVARSSRLACKDETTWTRVLLTVATDTFRSRYCQASPFDPAQVCLFNPLCHMPSGGIPVCASKIPEIPLYCCPMTALQLSQHHLHLLLPTHLPQRLYPSLSSTSRADCRCRPETCFESLKEAARSDRVTYTRVPL
jgi:hypothetical protein